MQVHEESTHLRLQCPRDEISREQQMVLDPGLLLRLVRIISVMTTMS
jgi:hypothetical protein